MQNSIIHTLLIGAIFLLFFACEPSEPATTRAELIEQKLQERIAQLHRNKQERCLDELLTEAGTIVDSILIERARRNKDMISKPPKPPKPERPDVFILQDTGSVRPLIIDSIQ